MKIIELSSLGADSRQGLNHDIVWRHTQHLPGGVPVLVGPATPDEAHAVLRDLAGALTTWSTEQIGIDVIIDCGRISTGLLMGALRHCLEPREALSKSGRSSCPYS
jgi:hypothetical protein